MEGRAKRQSTHRAHRCPTPGFGDAHLDHVPSVPAATAQTSGRYGRVLVERAGALGDLHMTPSLKAPCA